jgi:hypothetical protein
MHCAKSAAFARGSAGGLAGDAFHPLGTSPGCMTIALSWFTPGGGTVVLTGAVTNVVEEALLAPPPPPQPDAKRVTNAAPTANDRMAAQRSEDIDADGNDRRPAAGPVSNRPSSRE